MRSDIDNYTEDAQHYKIKYQNGDIVATCLVDGHNAKVDLKGSEIAISIIEIAVGYHIHYATHARIHHALQCQSRDSRPNVRPP